VLGNAPVTILDLMKQLQGFENMAVVDQTWISAYYEQVARLLVE
jgi:hypothetical protein